MKRNGATPNGGTETGYLAESRSFAVASLSILPLMLVYHWGIIQSGYGERNLAQVWLMGPLQLVGLQAAHLLNLALLVALLAVLWRGGKAKSFNLLTILGIVVEAVLYAALLFKGAPMLAALLDERASSLAFAIRWRSHASLCLALGAGVYEELFFRLLMVGGGVLLLTHVFLWNKPMSVAAVLLVSSLLFAAAHHLGPLGEPFESYSFLYRTVCGLLLGVVFLTRGLGVAVWTHAIYNALVLAQQAAHGA